MLCCAWPGRMRLSCAGKATSGTEWTEFSICQRAGVAAGSSLALGGKLEMKWWVSSEVRSGSCRFASTMTSISDSRWHRQTQGNQPAPTSAALRNCGDLVEVCGHLCQRQNEPTGRCPGTDQVQRFLVLPPITRTTKCPAINTTAFGWLRGDPRRTQRGTKEGEAGGCRLGSRFGANGGWTVWRVRLLRVRGWGDPEWVSVLTGNVKCAPARKELRCISTPTTRLAWL